MLGAFQGVGIIASLILLGWLLQRLHAFPSNTSAALAAFAYWAATPALLFSVLASEDLRAIAGAPLIVAAGSGVAAALVFLAVAVFFRPSRPDLTLGAMGASLSNAAYIGLPVATFILGSPHHVVTVLAFQLGFFTPMFFVLAELSGSRDQAVNPPRVIKTVIKNPLVVTAAVAVCWNLSPLPVPGTIEQATAFLGAAAPPAVLVAFGASLVGQSARIHRSTLLLAGWASAVKLLVQPAVGFGLGMLLGLGGKDLAAVTLMASLPTAQNVYIASTRARAGMEVAQGTVLITSALCLPVIVVLSALLL